jgi:hypothetical protein
VESCTASPQPLTKPQQLEAAPLDIAWTAMVSEIVTGAANDATGQQAPAATAIRNLRMTLIQFVAPTRCLFVYASDVPIVTVLFNFRALKARV